MRGLLSRIKAISDSTKKTFLVLRFEKSLMLDSFKINLVPKEFFVP